MGRFFLVALGNPDLGGLADPERCRLFKTWAELDPCHGLSWLEESTRIASDDQLATFDVPFGDGDWGVRRQVVWLCGGLASFAEHFWRCEAILFRLAQVETELGIANNSKGTWRRLFHPAQAPTEVPYRERLDQLLGCLRNVDHRTLPLVFGAFADALTAYMGPPIPPTVLGGRLTPEPWRPRTMHELHEWKVTAARNCLRTIGEIPETNREGILFFVVENIDSFINLGLMPELRSCLDILPEDGELRQTLRLALLQTLDRLERKKGHSASPEDADLLERVHHWAEELAPEDLVARIKELTAQDHGGLLSLTRRQEVSTHA